VESDTLLKNAKEAADRILIDEQMMTLFARQHTARTAPTLSYQHPRQRSVVLRFKTTRRLRFSKRASALEANIERQNAAKDELQQAFDKASRTTKKSFAQLDSLITQGNEAVASLELEIDQHRRSARQKQEANDEEAYRQLARKEKNLRYASKILGKVKEAEAKAKGR
jgi:hypothetical protein